MPRPQKHLTVFKGHTWQGTRPPYSPLFPSWSSMPHPNGSNRTHIHTHTATVHKPGGTPTSLIRQNCLDHTLSRKKMPQRSVAPHLSSDVCAYVHESFISVVVDLQTDVWPCVCVYMQMCVIVCVCVCVCAVMAMELTVCWLDLPLSVYTNPATHLGTALK